VNLGVALPSYPSISPRKAEAFARAIHGASFKDQWQRVGKPFEFAVVGMSRRQTFHHVGVWTEADGGLVVHVQEGTCTVADSLPDLKRLGWNRIEFFKWHTL
jgi:hypothetical protein